MITQEIIDEIIGSSGIILHIAELDHVICIVEQRNGVRWYHAREFDGESWDMGYSTKEKYHYMGQRYQKRELWGEYFGEVYYQPEEHE